MKFYSSIVFVLAIFVSSCRSVKVCDAVRCRREGSSGKTRIGHRRLEYKEMPYLAVLVKDGQPYCFGVLVKGSYRDTGRTFTGAVLSTCTCLAHNTAFEIGIGTPGNRYFKLDSLKKYERGTSFVFGCDTAERVIYEKAALDFGLLEVKNIYSFESAYFKSKDPDVISEYVNTLLENHENRCYGVGIGGYDFIAKPPEHEGKKENYVHLYDYRLITDDECDKYMPKCCRKWKSIGLKEESIKSIRIHCAIRNREFSSCFGNFGSPIVCDGYVIGFLKGHVKCDDKNNAGPDLFVPISRNAKDAFIPMKLPRSFIRPMPEPLPDSIGDFEIEEIFPTVDEESGKSGGSAKVGNKTKSGVKDSDDDDYYNAGNLSQKSLPIVILTTILNLIHIFST